MNKLLKRIGSFILTLPIIACCIDLSSLSTIRAYADDTHVFSYKDQIQSFTAPKTGKYSIVAYGGAGGTTFQNTDSFWQYNASGGKTTGNIVLTAGQTIYITTGGIGSVSSSGGASGGYNGGGASSQAGAGSGGGATLVSYTSSTIDSVSDSDIILIAGGGGGQGRDCSTVLCLGNGGGYNGGSTPRSVGGTQEAGYRRGIGQDAYGANGAGGGGYYGGYASTNSNYGGGGGSGYINTMALSDSTTNFVNWRKSGEVTIQYIGKATSTLIVSTGSNGTIAGANTKTYTGNVGETITLPTPDLRESFIKFDEYIKTGGDGTLNGLSYTFGCQTTYLDAKYSGSRADLDMTQNGDTVYISLIVDSIDSQTVNLLGKTEFDSDWKRLGVYVSGSVQSFIEKISVSRGNGGATEYTALFTGTYRIKLRGSGGGADGNSNGGSGASMEFTVHLDEGDKLKIISSTNGQDSDANSGIKSGGYGIASGGYGCWSGGGGGASGVQIYKNGAWHNLAIAAGGGGGNWAAGYGGRKSTDSSVGNVGGSNGEGGVWDNGHDDTGGGGAGWYGGLRGEPPYRGGYGGQNGYNASLVSEFKIVSESNGITGGGHNTSEASLQPASLDNIASIGKNDKLAIKIKDVLAPEIPSNSGIKEATKDSIGIYLEKTKDFGNYYYVQVPGYSDTKKFFYKSGFNGWHYVVDTNENTTVTTSDTYTTTNNVKLPISTAKRYFHVATVDKAGNLSNTYTFEVPSCVTITYDKNDTAYNINGDKCTTTATGSMNDQIIVFGGIDNLYENGYTKKGYTFDHWNTASDDSGVIFRNKQQVSFDNIVDKFGYVLKLYAIWKPIEYNIYYEKGLTSDVKTTSIADATRNINIQSTGADRPYTNTKYDSPVKFATIASLNGREYTLKFDSNKPSSIVKQKVNRSATTTTVAPITGNLPSLNKWQITGQESGITNNLKPTMGSKVTGPNYKSVDKASATATALWKNKELTSYETPTLKGWKFVGWYDNQAVNKSTAVSNTTDMIRVVNETNNISPNTSVTTAGNVISYTVQPNTTKFNQTLYARWQRTINLTFNMNGGQYQGSTDDVTLTGIYYNNADGYNFSLTNEPTIAKIPDYEKQQNTIDAYGTYGANGENSKYIREDADGTIYRFIGWSLDKNAKEPDRDLIVYNTGRGETYRVYDDSTLYAVWEPILIVNFSLNRTLGNLRFDNGESPVNSALNIRGTDDIKYVSTIAKPGEQCDYTCSFTGKTPAEAYTKFESKVTDIYTHNGVWTDNLNPSTGYGNPLDGLEDLIESQQHGLDRHIITNSNHFQRKFYMPQYIGTQESYETSKGITAYNALFTVAQDSFYYKYVHNKMEQVEIAATIYTTTQTPSVGPGGSGGTTPPGVISVLNELRTKIKMRSK